MHDGHLLLPPEVLSSIPPLNATEETKDPTVWLKWFTPDSSWTWFVTEFDPEKRLAFGLVVGQETELGYFSIEELEASRGPLGLRIERDLSWKPRPLSQCDPTFTAKMKGN
jgi:hypothetical protein